MTADAWSTALNVLGADEGLKVAEANGVAALFVIRESDGRFTEKLTSQFVTVRERSGAVPPEK